VDEQAVQRLNDAWREVSPHWQRERRTTWWWTTVRIAAVIAIVVMGATWWQGRRGGPLRTHPAQHPAQMVMNVRPAAQKPIGREPTRIELAMLKHAFPATAPAIPPATAPGSSVPKATEPRGALAQRPLGVEQRIGLIAQPDMPEARRQELLQALLSDSQSPRAIGAYLRFVDKPDTREAALRAAKTMPNPPVEAMFAALSSSSLVSQREAAARVLARIDGPAVTQRLATMAMQNQSRREALSALAMIDTKDAHAFLDRAAQSGPLAGAVRSARLQDLQ
jgi:hypothetical protein